MKLDVNFSELEACARQMGAVPDASDFTLQIGLPPLEPVSVAPPYKVETPQSTQVEVGHVDATS